MKQDPADSTRPTLVRSIVSSALAFSLVAGGAVSLAITGAVSAATSAAAVTPVVPTTPSASTVTLTPTDDAFISKQQPTKNFGTAHYLDVYGGTQPMCTQTADRPTGFTGPAYGLLKFDLSSIPAGAVITGARLQMISRTGYAQDGDQNDHVIRLADTSWTESTVTWNTAIEAAGLPSTVRTSTKALGSDSVWRNDCNLDIKSTDENLTTKTTAPLLRTQLFPNNGFVSATDQSMTRDAAETNFVAAVADARSAGANKLSLALYNPPGPNGKAYWARYYTKETTNAANRPKLILTFASATVSRAVAPVTDPSNNVTSTAISGIVHGTANTVYTVDVTAAAGCVNGKLVNPTRLGTFPPVTTNTQGNAEVAGFFPGTPAFVTVTLTSASNELSTSSTCVAVGPDNDTWTRAKPIQLTTAADGSLTGTGIGFVDQPGGARWYRFPVQPGGRVKVDLTGPNVDLDMAVFTDISQAFTNIVDNHDLTKLSAEYAPSVFSPSVFSPSVFSPSVFSPDAYSPSVFSPSVFSPSVFSPSVFSPSVFSPSVFSPSVFSPSVFSPSVFSPSVFSPSVFSPSVFSPSVFSDFVNAYSSAQTRSLVQMSANTGTSTESVAAETWNTSGNFYVRVTGRNGVASTDAPISVKVTRSDLAACASVSPITVRTVPVGGNYSSIILFDPTRMTYTAADAAGRAAELAALTSKLTTLASQPSVNGAVVDLSTNADIVTLNAQADAHPGCPYAKNLVAAGIKSIVGAYRGLNPSLAYVVLVGPDGAIPFFRYPDEGLLGPESDYVPPVGATTASDASLRLDYVLGQDEYGAFDTLQLGNVSMPVPDLAVGRLVETAKDASGLIDAYLALNGGVVATPTSALVTGYDFLADAANSVAGDLSAGMGTSVDTLIAPNNISPQDPSAWTADQLGTKLFGTRHDIAFLAGHFSANSALAADFSTSVITTQLEQSNVNLANSIVFSAGCHSGYNIYDPDAVPGVTLPLDWVQAFAHKQATLIAGTGYQYGDTDFLEYSERIYAEFAHQLRVGSGPVSVGQALMQSKKSYLRQTPDPRGLHRKSLIESTLFGLPMLSVNLPSGRVAATPDTSVIGTTTTAVAASVDPGLTLGLKVADTNVGGTLDRHDVPLTTLDGSPAVTATYYSGPGGAVESNPGEPTLPLLSQNVTMPGNVLRGVGFRGGSYSDSTVVPLTGAATSELRGVHTPFVSPVMYPMRLATTNYFDALGSNPVTRLLVTPAQHQAIPGTNNSTLRLYGSGVDVRLFYSNYLGAAAQVDAPSISGVVGRVSGNDIVFDATVVGAPAAGIHSVWVTYTGDISRWASVDLVQDSVDSTHWTGKLLGGATNASKIKFVVQAANGVGMVSLDDALGVYYSVGGNVVGAATSLALTPLASNTLQHGTSVPVTATLTTGANAAVADKAVIFTLGATSLWAKTDTNGRVTVKLPVNALPGAATLIASYGGDAGVYSGSTASISVTITKAPTTLTLKADGATGLDPRPSVTAGLTDVRGTGLGSRNLFAIVTPTTPVGAAPVVTSLITDYLGNVKVPLPITSGSYTVETRFLTGVPSASIPDADDPVLLPSNDVRTVTVLPRSDVGVSIAAPATATVGISTSITFSVTNAVSAPDAAPTVHLSATLPGSIGSLATVTAGCGFTAQALDCDLGSIAPGAKVDVVVTGVPTATGAASVTAGVTGGPVDLSTLNNTATAGVALQSLPTAPVVNGPASVNVLDTYSATASSTGVPTPTFSLTNSPSWLSIDSTSGAISGKVPTGITSFTYTVVASNAAGSTPGTPVTVSVWTPPTAPLVVGPAAVIGGNLYSATVTSTGYPTPVLSMTVNPGFLSFEASTGKVTTTPGFTVPTGQASFSYTITATNNGGSVDTVVTVNIWKLPSVPTVTATPPALPASVTAVNAGMSYAATASSSGIPNIITYSLKDVATTPVSTIGLQLSIDANSGLISGVVPTDIQAFTYTVVATNDAGSTSSAPIKVDVWTPPTKPVNGGPSSVIGGTTYSSPNPSSGYPAPTFSLGANDPAFLTIDSTTGVVSTPGSVTVPTNITTFTYTVTATNAGGSASTSVTVAVWSLPTVPNVNGPSIINVGQTYSATATSTGEPATMAYTLLPTSDTGVALPSFLSIAPDTGVITGLVPSGIQSFTFTVRATNAAGGANKTVVVAVYTPPSAPVVTGPTSVTAGAAYSATAASTGFPAPTYSLAAGAPSWLTINANTGVIGGTVPATAGGTTFSYTVVASNQPTGTTLGGTASTLVTVTVKANFDLAIVENNPLTMSGGKANSIRTEAQNKGLSSVSGIVITDTLPSQLTFKTALSYGPGWSCSAVGQKVTCTYTGTLAPGAVTPDVIIPVNVAKVTANTPVVNTVEVTPTDSNPGNNKLSWTITITKV